MQQFPPSGLNYSFSKAARALLTVPFIVIFSQPSCWPFATPHPSMGPGPGDQLCETTGGSAAGLFWPQGNQGKRAAGQVAWGVPRWSIQCQAPVPLGGRPWHHISAGPGRSAAGMCKGRKFHLHGQCLPVSCSLTAQFAFAGFMN